MYRPNTIRSKQHKGESILEILLAIAIFAIVLPPVLYTMGLLAGGEPKRNIYFDATVYTEDAKTAVQQMKSASWATVATNGTYSLDTVGGAHTLTPVAGTPTPAANGLIRTITIADVYRESGQIVSTGGVVDSATKKISIQVSWDQSQDPLVTEYYITRTDALGTFRQSSDDDFTQGGASFAGTQVVSGSEPEDATIALGLDEPEPAVGLRSWWKMKGDYAAIESELDQAANGSNNLNIHGAVTFTQGKYGNKAQFTAPTTYMSASSSASLDITGQLSVTAWIRSEGVAEASAIVYKQTSTGDGYRLEVLADGKMVATIGNQTTSISAQDTTHTITDGLWHHIAMTYDGSILRIYVDGQRGDVDGTGVGLLGSNAEPLFIARDPSAQGGTFTGEIDDVQIYQVALTDDEIQKLIYSTYTSTIKDFGSSILVHTIKASIDQPAGTRVAIQTSFQEAVNGSCEGVDYRYVGPASTEDSYFTTDQVGVGAITGSIPSLPEEPLFTNPAQCLRYRVYLYSPHNPGTNDPTLGDIRFSYTQ